MLPIFSKKHLLMKFGHKNLQIKFFEMKWFCMVSKCGGKKPKNICHIFVVGFKCVAMI
jgi:hypothetical protein